MVKNQHRAAWAEQGESEEICFSTAVVGVVLGICYFAAGIVIVGVILVAEAGEFLCRYAAGKRR